MVQIPIGLLGSEDALRRALEGAGNLLDPLAQGGQQAFDLQAALSGALGAPSQANAFADFQSSPGQQFLRDESEQALLRNASAIGGIGGGRVREALQQNAIGLAQQDFGNQFSRLGSVAGQGLPALGQQAGFVQQAGRDLSAGRTQAGRDISGNIGGATSALAQLVAQQGAGLGDILGTGAGNLSNILSAAGTGQLGSQTQLATILANLAVQQGSQLGGLTGVQGIQQTTGALESIGNLLSGVGSIVNPVGGRPN